MKLKEANYWAEQTLQGHTPTKGALTQALQTLYKELKKCKSSKTTSNKHSQTSK